MKPERWNLVQDLLLEALELEPERFVRQAHLFADAPDMDRLLDGLRAAGTPE